MKCTICSIKNNKLKAEIELLLYKNSGTLSSSDISTLLSKFPEDKEDIEAIQDQDCMIHWNFHQTVHDKSASTAKPEEAQEESLTKDIHKSEAVTLQNLVEKQLATFNCLSNKINKSIESTDPSDMNKIVINPTTLELYNGIPASIRSSINLLKELNADINGSKSDSLQGLKALVGAISGQKENVEEQQDLTTDQFDD